MLIATLLRAIVKAGRITLLTANGERLEFGAAGASPHVTVRLHDRAVERKLVLNPKLAFGEAFMEGTLTIEEGTLYDFLDILAQSSEVYDRTRVGRLFGWWDRSMRRLQQFNPTGRAKRNVAHHYDLSGRLYDLFLDRDRQYSCAYFAGPHVGLEQAQEDKKRHIAAKLLLQPGQKVLDIGSGWGGLALYLARQARADVTGVTLSEEQHKVSAERALRDGLANRVRFHLRDYRDEAGRYDRIVSVGMFEHVGARHYDEFFRKVHSLLKDDGVMLLHSIGRMSPPGTTNPWIRKYIFPGGYSPALSEVLAAIERAGLWVTDIEILRLHYAETLREWHRRFQANRAEIARLYDERFCRMWEFYLIACEVSFRRMGQMVFQMQIAKRVDAVPMVRDYMVDRERALAPAASHGMAAE